MTNTSTIIWSALAAMIVYKLVTYLYFLQLKKDLQNASLEFFILRLGTNYKYKHLTNGTMRYKWAKRWITIRANFDERGQFVKKDMVSGNFLKILAEYTF